MKFDDLEPKNRLMVLKWMYDGLNAAISKQVAAKTYQAYSEHLNQKKPFVANDIWDHLQPPLTEHFERTGKILDHLETEMDKCRPKTEKPEAKVQLQEVDKVTIALETPEPKTEKRSKKKKR